MGFIFNTHEPNALTKLTSLVIWQHFLLDIRVLYGVQIDEVKCTIYIRQSVNPSLYLLATMLITS